MPRFRLTHSTNSDSDHFVGDVPDDRVGRLSDSSSDESFDESHDYFDDEPRARRRRSTRGDDGVRLVLEGKSGRSRIDVDDPTDADTADTKPAQEDFAIGGEPARAAASPALAPYSSYDVAAHGPDPVPDWVVTSLSARDTRLGTIKSGKEADVGLLDRSLPGGPGCLLAVKTFRSADHRMFHRDAGYQEGRRIRRSRETRAMATRTAFGRELLSGQWANAEFTILSAMWKAGARVPYPVQMIGSELMMEFIGEPDGTAAPRLAAFTATTSVFVELWHDLVSSLEVLAESGLTHGDLSAYNVLVDDKGCVVIDLPQAVDLVANPQGAEFLRRDCRNIAEFFTRRGVLAADADNLALHLWGLAGL